MSRFLERNLRASQSSTIAAQGAVSWIYAGIRYRFDVNAGEEIGRKLAATAVARHREMLSRTTQTLLTANR